MKKGKRICETLKGIRRDIARANEIDYNPEPCTYEGDCDGTCPRCESEVRWLERQLLLRQSLGKAITIAGLTMATGTFATSCNIFHPSGQVVKGKIPAPVDTTKQVQVERGKVPAPVDTVQVLEGDVMMMPDSATVCPAPAAGGADSEAPDDSGKNHS